MYINLNIGTKYVTGFAELLPPPSPPSPLLLLCSIHIAFGIHAIQKLIDSIYKCFEYKIRAVTMWRTYYVYMGMKAKTRIEIKPSRNEANGYINIHPYVRTYVYIYIYFCISVANGHIGDGGNSK